MSKLIEYMPAFLKDVREFNEIFDTEDIELEELDYNVKKMLTEVIVKMADSYGLDRYEKIYDIKNVSTDIEVRRSNILACINKNAALTLKWLDNHLKGLVGENNYKIEVIYNEYLLVISLLATSSKVSELYQEDLRKKIPANLNLRMKIYTDLNCNNACVIRNKSYMKLVGKEC